MSAEKHDIKDRSDIEVLVNSFYDKIKADATVGYIFNDIIGDDWSKHMPVMYSFWETVLLGKAGYQGNPIIKHIEVDKRIELKTEHYERWLSIWQNTVNEMFVGDVANNAKDKAKTMMQLIDMKVTAARTGKSIL